MPFFSEPNCLKKIIIFLVTSIFLTIFLAYSAFYFISGVLGIIVALVIESFSLILLWYLIDVYGDKFFLDDIFAKLGEKSHNKGK